MPLNLGTKTLYTVPDMVDAAGCVLRLAGSPKTKVSRATWYKWIGAGKIEAPTEKYPGRAGLLYARDAALKCLEDVAKMWGLPVPPNLAHVLISLSDGPQLMLPFRPSEPR